MVPPTYMHTLRSMLSRLDEGASSREADASRLAEDVATIARRAHEWGIGEGDARECSLLLGKVLAGPLGMDITHELSQEAFSDLDAAGIDVVDGLARSVLLPEPSRGPSREVWDEREASPEVSEELRL